MSELFDKSIRTLELPRVLQMLADQAVSAEAKTRALAVRPSILLMDEPASALDPISTSKIEDLIYELKKEYTIVIVTHNMQQAARVSDRTAFFYLGELIEYDDTQKIFVSPTKEATQNYVTGRFG